MSAAATLPGITGVVLAGGRSRRMGTDKAVLEYEGRPLIERVAERLEPLCAELLIASGDGRRLGRDDEIADAWPDAGPLGGLLAGLRHAQHDLVAVVGVDMPWASPAVLGGLGQRLAISDDAEAAVPWAAGRVQPLHAVYRRACADTVERWLAQGGRSVTGLLDRLVVNLVPEDDWRHWDPTGRFAHNLNTPADLP